MVTAPTTEDFVFALQGLFNSAPDPGAIAAGFQEILERYQGFKRSDDPSTIHFPDGSSTTWDEKSNAWELNPHTNAEGTSCPSP